jgi:hypothetical protein
VCIMEVRPGQHITTVSQAMAHNLSTVDRDLDMLRKLCQARHDHAAMQEVDELQRAVHAAYAQALTMFGVELARVEADSAGHVHDHDHGNERSFIETAHHDARLARPYETR